METGSALPRSQHARDGRGLPAEIEILLDGPNEPARAEAWDEFVRRYSRLLLHTAHARSNGYDDAMDRYAFVLEALREDDFRRLRAFDPDNSARFSTWLVVVAGRLCIDYHRRRYGAGGNRAPEDGDWRRDLRRRLADLISANTDLARFADSRREVRPDMGVREGELREALFRAVSSLSGRDRMLLRLRYHDGLTAREIGEIMTFPSLFHVYRRLNKVLRELRDDLESRGIRDAVP